MDLLFIFQSVPEVDTLILDRLPMRDLKSLSEAHSHLAHLVRSYQRKRPFHLEESLERAIFHGNVSEAKLDTNACPKVLSNLLVGRGFAAQVGQDKESLRVASLADLGREAVHKIRQSDNELR